MRDESAVQFVNQDAPYFIGLTFLERNLLRKVRVRVRKILFQELQAVIGNLSLLFDQILENFFLLFEKTITR